MRQVFLGEAIKKRRMELGLTQEQLCEGICEPFTISRIENGRQTPSRKRINAILKRLSLPADRYYALVSENEQEVSELQRQISAFKHRFGRAFDDEREQIREQAAIAFEQLEAVIEEADTVRRQFLVRSRITIGKPDGEYSLDEQKEMLTDAIRLSAPYFNVLKINKGIYSVDEIKLIDLLACAYSHNNLHTEAINIYIQLYEYINKHFANNPTTRAGLTMISANYAKELLAIGDPQKAVDIALEGKQTCLDYGYYRSLPLLLAVLADAYYHLGDINNSRQLYYQAYYLMFVIGDERNLHNLKQKAKTDLDLDFQS